MKLDQVLLKLTADILEERPSPADRSAAFNAASKHFNTAASLSESNRRKAQGKPSKMTEQTSRSLQ